ncbi:16S rRNA (uracil(1498)-N(3))-methyltransferase [Crenobacter cavernae]|uniref:Ribosomal RNA small subunit methyltransferase E n=1 Tax=Crenobacter cavernae TaxID=2290923 RepID=A0A345Y501_9NEIS|nr:16S rRNA (uracil(1498)-N(3))-methyltransferase [Crenobacter cavernae]AXK39003.1 16S rRNA (uracil(1498)-N(3))-methyltransferase [Crenobacter cavernae]
MPRFFVDAALVPGAPFELPEPVLRHVQVLRLKEGDALTLFDGRGGEVAATLSSLEKRRATVTLGQHRALERESRLTIGLVQAVSSGEKMDFTLQKGVELGVSFFQPVLSERSVVRLSGDRADKRVARWQDIVVSACEQSGRNRIPEVRPLITYDEWLKQAPPDAARLMLSPLGTQKLSTLAEAPSRAWLLAGPEGGLTAKEEAAAMAAGWQPLKLGERILRTETAALAAVAALQTLWGDFA